MLYNTPEAVIRKTTFGNETVNVRVPLQGSPERVKDADESRDKVFRLIDVMEHPQDNTAHGVEETVKEGTVMQKERAKLFVNSKNTVSVGTVDQFKGHGDRTFLTVFDAAGGTKAALTTERNKFHVGAVRADIYRAAKRWVTAV